MFDVKEMGLGLVKETTTSRFSRAMPIMWPSGNSRDRGACDVSGGSRYCSSRLS